MPRTHFRGRTSKQRLTQWVGPADQGFIAVATGGATIVGFASFEEAVTAIRTRGMVSVRPQAFAAGVDVVGAIGLGIVSTEAFVAGIVSVPEPFNDADWGGWFVWRSFAYRFDFSTNEGALNFDWTFEVDSKAMRRITPNETVVMVAESQVGAYSIAMPLRMLVKLS